MALRVERVVARADHVLILARRVGHVLQNFGDGLAGDGDAVAMQQAVRRAASSSPAGCRRRDADRSPRTGPRASGRTAPARLRACARSRRWSSGTSAACAIARRCSTALVEPPVAITTAIAFSKDLRVMMCARQQICLRIAFDQHVGGFGRACRPFPVRRAIVEEYGRLMPIASNAERHRVGGVHAAARARAGAGVALDPVEVSLRHLAAR